MVLMVTLGVVGTLNLPPAQAFLPHPPTVPTTFKHLDYVIQVQPDGDLLVNEHWEINFTQSTYHAFEQLFTAKTTGIEFGDIRGDGVNHIQRRKTVVPLSNIPVERADWYFPTTFNATRTFDIAYTIHGALGVGADQDWLDWHFLDESYGVSDPVTESTVTIKFSKPFQSSDLAVHDAYSYTAESRLITTKIPDASTVAIVGHDLYSNGFLEAEIAFPRDAASINHPKRGLFHKETDFLRARFHKTRGKQ